MRTLRIDTYGAVVIRVLPSACGKYCSESYAASGTCGAARKFKNRYRDGKEATARTNPHAAPPRCEERVVSAAAAAKARARARSRHECPPMKHLLFLQACACAFAAAEALSPTSVAPPRPVEQNLAERAAPLEPSPDAAAALRSVGVARFAGAVPSTACDTLRAKVIDWLAADDDDGSDKRFVAQTRLRLSAPLRAAFAGARADLLLPVEDAAVGAVAAAALRAATPAIEAARVELFGAGADGPLEIVELGAVPWCLRDAVCAARRGRGPEHPV